MGYNRGYYGSRRGRKSGLAVNPLTPVNTVAPAVTGFTPVGSTLTTTNGTWTNSPVGYAYQWRRNGTPIGGATSSTYVTVTADAGTTVTCRVAATNAIPLTGYGVSNGIAVDAASSSTFYGMNVGGATRQYNNLLLTNYWRGDAEGNDGYAPARPPYIDVTGEIASCEPGLANYKREIGLIGASVTSRIAVTWTGQSNGVSVSNLGGYCSNFSYSTNRIEFDYAMPATLPASSICFVECDCPLFNSGNPWRNFDAREITGVGGAFVNTGSFDPAFISRITQYGIVRTMDLQITNNTTFTTPGAFINWSQRRTAQRALDFSTARLIYGTGTSKLVLLASTYIQMTNTVFATYLPNNHWFGAGGNNMTLTINAASGAGSVVVTGLSIVVTPAAGAATADAIKAQIDAHPTANKMVTVTSGGTGAVAPLAATNFKGGGDPPYGSYVPELVELANAVNAVSGARLYCNLPYIANADYATGFANYLNANLVNKNVCIEYGNEPWNYAFGASGWLNAWSAYNGRSTGNIVQTTANEYAARAVSVLGAVKAVNASFKGISGAFNGTTDFLGFCCAVTGFNGTNIGAPATAPYFYPDYTQASDTVYFNAAYQSVNDVITAFLANDAVAAANSITSVITYEGGQHDLGLTLADNQRRQRSATMKAVYGYYLSELKRRANVGSTREFIHYLDVAPITTGASGAFGLQEYVGQPPASAPKYAAYSDAVAGIYPPYLIYPNAPSISGTSGSGNVLTVTTSTPYNTASISYQWKSNGTNVGTNASTYTQVSGDAGHTMTCDVTLNGTGGGYTRTYTATFVPSVVYSFNDDVTGVGTTAIRLNTRGWNLNSGFAQNGIAQIDGYTPLNNNISINGKTREIRIEFDPSGWTAFLSMRVDIVADDGSGKYAAIQFNGDGSFPVGTMGVQLLANSSSGVSGFSSFSQLVPHVAIIHIDTAGFITLTIDGVANGSATVDNTFNATAPINLNTGAFGPGNCVYKKFAAGAY